MNNIHGSGIWSAIARNIVETAAKGATKQVINNAGNTIVDGTSISTGKRIEQLLDDKYNEIKEKEKT